MKALSKSRSFIRRAQRNVAKSLWESNVTACFGQRISGEDLWGGTLLAQKLSPHRERLPRVDEDSVFDGLSGLFLDVMIDDQQGEGGAAVIGEDPGRDPDRRSGFSL